MAHGDNRNPITPVLVIIPTYNERENLPLIVKRLNDALPEVHALIVDDGSPDGTGDLADEIAAQDPRVHVLHRTTKAGLGAAYLAGFHWGLARDYATLVEMDADGSHAPEDLPRMLAALEHSDAVIGSRYVPGGRVVNWPVHRKLISRGGGFYTRVALGIGIKDPTAGFRAYRREVLEKLSLNEVASQGYCFQIDLTWRALRAGFTITEVPITFTERALGHSKMSSNIMREAMLRVGQWGLQHRSNQVRSLLQRKK